MDHALPASAQTPLHASLLRERPLVVAGLGFLLLALLLRSPWFGNPIAGYDEQFYLLTGDRLLHGQLPYVDIWDRKPFGLFLIYAVAAAFGEGVLAYQLMAALFSAATALVIMAIARRDQGDVAAAMAGVVYLVWLLVMSGAAGQSPVFYNLPIALAALLVLRAGDAIRAREPHGRPAIAAMLLGGIALQIKPTVVFECAFLGLALLLAGARAGWPATLQLRRAGAYVAAGIAATAAVMLFYAAQGAFDAFWYANVVSAMSRTDGWGGESLAQLGEALVSLSPVAILGILGHALSRRRRDDAFLALWLIAATFGFLSVGYFYHHYALPLLVPMAVASARFFDRPRLSGLALAMLCLPPSITALGSERARIAGDRAQIAAVVAAIPDEVRTGCMLVYEGPPILYHLTRACAVTPFQFPDHLYSSREAPAIGIDQHAALAQALARRPAVVVLDGKPEWRLRNPANDRLIAAALTRGYRLIARRPYRYYYDPHHELQVWQRTDLVRQLSKLDR